MRAPLLPKPNVHERGLHPWLRHGRRADLVWQRLRGPPKQQPQLRGVRHDLSVRRAVHRRGMRVLPRLHAVRVRAFQGPGLLRRPNVEQRELRGLPQPVPRKRSLLQRWNVRGSLRGARVLGVQRHVREPANGQIPLRPLLGGLRWQPPLQKRAVRMPCGDRRLRGHLLGSAQRPDQLRHVRDPMHVRPRLRKRHLPIGPR